MTGLPDAVIHLRVLGSVDLYASDGTQLSAVLRQPKRIALLIYLALNRDVYHRRDRLLAMFWPDLAEDRARNALSQAVHHLRTSLGKHVIVSRGDDEIGLAPGAVWCDIAAFEDALAEGRLADAMAHYEGDLAPSFVLAESNDFTDWLDDRRNHSRTEAVNACIRLAEESANARDAATWLRKAIALDRLSEAAYQRLILVLDRAGDRAAALQVFDDLRDLLQREFDAEPSAETLDVVREVRERAEANHRIPLQLRVTRAEIERLKRSPRAILATISVVLIMSAVLWTALLPRPPKPYRPPANRVAVLYFRDQSETHDLGYLTEGLTSTLIDQLGQVQKLQIISQNGVRPFRGDSIRLDTIAKQLDVGTIVGGSITRSGDRLRVTVELIDGVTGLVLHSRTVERPRKELFALLDDISGEVSSFLRITVGQEVRLREWRSETQSVDAWQALQQAEQLHAQAEEHDASGNTTEAWTLLARADSSAARALEIDKRFASAEVLRGFLAEQRAWMSFMAEQPPNPTKWLAAARERSDRALALDRTHAGAHELRGAVDYWSWLLAPPNGQASDSLLRTAETHLRQSIQLAGELPRAESILSALLQSRGDFRGARIAAARALEADAYLTDADQIVNRLFETSFQVGDDAEAARWCEEVRRRFTGHWPSAWCDLVLLGWSNETGHDPRKAMHLVETFGPSDPEPVRAAMLPRVQMLAAAVLGRAHQQSEADSLLMHAKRAAPQDVELLHLEAAARVMMNQDERALQLLRDYLKRNPGARDRIINNRMFGRIRARLAQGQTMMPLT